MSTLNIDDLAAKFAKQVNDELAAFRAEAAKKENKQLTDIAELKLKVSDLAVTKIRTPLEQAQELVKGVSWTCSSSHMSDTARHVALAKNGKYVAKPSSDLTPEEYKAFTEAWNGAMTSYGLLNYAGKHGFNESDAYHLELPDSKLPFTDKRVQECLGHYAKMTRKDGKQKNMKFENGDAKIKKFLEDYEKKK